MTAPTTSSRRWAILAIGTLTQAATTSFLYGVAVLFTDLRRAEHLSLVATSVLISAPAVGLMLTLVAFGAAADRYGERVVIASGVSLSAVFLTLAAVVHGPVLLALMLGLAGAGAGSVNAASGRMIMGWFSVKERGFAMGTRQTAQPLGVAVAAITLPPLSSHFGPQHALFLPTALCALSALAAALFIINPPRPVAVAGAPLARSPYRGNWTLVRIHIASALLVMPQFTVSTYTLVFLVDERHWSAVGAGRLVFAFQLVGAAGRIVSGVWSDRVGSRLRPMRQLAISAAVLMAALAIGAWTNQWWIAVVFGIASIITVADNGLSYVAVAEIADSGWAGRALGIQNTGQSIAALAIVPALAATIEGFGYEVAFSLVALAALIAAPITPVRAEKTAPARIVESATVAQGNPPATD